MRPILEALLQTDDFLKQEKYSKAITALTAISVDSLFGVEKGIYHRQMGEALLFF